jgi:homoserine kinase type II
MAAHTQLSARELNDWLPQFAVGSLSDFAVISSGIENSNYYVNTLDSNGLHHWVLTILEQQYPSRELLVPLAHRLHQCGLPVARIQPSTAGESIVQWQGKPAILSSRLPGEHPVNPTRSQCAAVGRFLARFHRAAATTRAHAMLFARDLNWLTRHADQVRTYLPYEDQVLLQDALSLIRSLLDRRDLARLPTGIVHGDLFRDNVLFNEQGLSGVLDFHHAGEHYLLFDLAVAANDWCTDGSGHLDPERTVSLLRDYHRERALTTEEVWFLPIFMIYAAAAFWLSRLAVCYPPRRSQPAEQKNPDEFRTLLAQRYNHFYYFDQRLLDR